MSKELVLSRISQAIALHDYDNYMTWAFYCVAVLHVSAYTQKIKTTLKLRLDVFRRLLLRSILLYFATVLWYSYFRSLAYFFCLLRKFI